MRMTGPPPPPSPPHDSAHHPRPPILHLRIPTRPNRLPAPYSHRPLPPSGVRPPLNSSCPSFACAAVSQAAGPCSSRRRGTSPSSLRASGSTTGTRALASVTRRKQSDGHTYAIAERIGEGGYIPGRNTAMYRPHSSSRPRCRTRHSNSAPRIASPNAASRRTRTRPRRPVRQ